MGIYKVLIFIYKLKVKQMETNKKEVMVVMLSAKQYTGGLVVNTYINPKKHNRSPIQYKPKITSYDSIIERGYIPQHLYFITDDTIVEGDWTICIDKGKYRENTLRKATKATIKYIFSSTDKCIKKIIATTDLLQEGIRFNKPWYLPQPSQAFIKKYTELGGIDKVMVEYETLIAHNSEGNRIEELILKTNSYNEISISSIKDSWSREEVINIIHKAYEYGYNNLTSVNGVVKKLLK